MIEKDLTLNRVTPLHSQEWINNYLNPSIFDEESYLNEFNQFIIDNCDFEYIRDYEINGHISNFFIPKLKLALKLIDLKSYCELNVDKKNQLNAYLEYEKQNIHLIQIFEDIWRDKKDIVKSRILNLFGKSKKIYARKCEILIFNEKDNRIVTKFINNNHIQGSIGSFVKLGLKYNNDIVSIMTFGKLRKNMGQKGGEGDFELLRFCSLQNYSVVGGASKLFNFFIKTYNPKNIVSYADMMWSSSDNIYKKLNLEFKHKSDPSYFYIVGKVRKNRFGYRKNVLLECGFDGEYWTEHDICYSNKIYRIFDVGTEKFVWLKN